MPKKASIMRNFYLKSTRKNTDAVKDIQQNVRIVTKSDKTIQIPYCKTKVNKNKKHTNCQTNSLIFGDPTMFQIIPIHFILSL